eukprot:TRINITY_DN7454_c0_g1_i1.p1 TRINITY_DN7454_c0_g1~~TRINITY_DN7454_c0_g1_i1.p1  ORF type:complete len:394 (-),score=87.24 TRINITY_DN7454_c0_g1_i1:506-1666(-)
MSKSPIVCDTGTGFIKLGYAGKNFPECVVASCVGRPLMRYDEEFKNIKLKDVMLGDEASENRALLEVTMPIENGIVRNWDDMELLWSYCFKERMGISPSDYKVLLTEPPSNPINNKKKMIETMLEKYNFQGARVSLQAIMVLYSQGLLTGVVLDTGDGVSHVVPITDGTCNPNLIKRLDVAGRHVTRYLIKLLQCHGYNFNRSADMETVRLIKEKYCYVAADPKLEEKLALDTTALTAVYTLPDGRSVKLSSERYQAPELLFNPGLNGEESKGIHEILFNTINESDIDLRAQYYQQIVLSGGTTMFPGLTTRLEKEMKRQYLQRILKGDKERLKKFKLRIEDPPRRKHMVWNGAAVLADIMKDKDEFWITKQEWKEQGERVFGKKG